MTMDDTIESQSPDWFPITISNFSLLLMLSVIFFSNATILLKDNMQLFIVAMVDFESTIFVVYFVERNLLSSFIKFMFLFFCCCI